LTFDLLTENLFHVTRTKCIWISWIIDLADFVPRCYGQPPLPWQLFCVPLVGGRPHVVMFQIYDD